MMKQIFKRFISYACATALAVSGISFSGLDATTITAHADYSIYDTNISCEDDADQFDVGDTDSHSFTANLQYWDVDLEDTVIVDDDDHTITYIWSLDDTSCFEFVGEDTGKSVQIKLTDNASTILGNGYLVKASLECTATIDGENANTTGMALTLNSDTAKKVYSASITPATASFDANNKSASFTVNGLDGIELNNLAWSLEYGNDDQIFMLAENGRTATVTLQDDAAEKWETIKNEDDEFYAGCLSCKLEAEDPENSVSIPQTVSLVYYPDGMYGALKVYITDDEDDPSSLSSYSIYPDEESAFYPFFNEPYIATKLTNVHYSWSLDSTAEKCMDIVGSSTSESVTLKGKNDPDIGDELTSEGKLTLTVTATELDSPITEQIDVRYTAATPDFELAFDYLRFDSTTSKKISKIKKYDEEALNGLEVELSGDHAEDIFTISDTDKISALTITAKAGAADIITNNGWAESDEYGNVFFTATLDYILKSSTGNTSISLGSVNLEYYLEGLYQVEYDKQDLYFTNGVAEEKTITATVTNPTNKSIIYKWSLDQADPEAVKCFTVSGNGNTAKVIYNGTETPDTWFALNLEISVEGNMKVLSKQPKIYMESAPDEEESWTITLSKDMATLSETKYTYDGNEKKPAVTVVYNGTTLIQGTHYNVEYRDNIQVGTAKAIITGLFPYDGVLELSFTIEAAPTEKPSDNNNQDSDNNSQNNNPSDQTSNDNSQNNQDSGGNDQNNQSTTSKPAKKGTKVTDSNSKTNGKFKVTSSEEGKAEVSYTAPSNKKAKKITIPSTVKDSNGATYKVTKIQAKAFKKNKTVTSVNIPKTVTTIGANAFNGASHLKTIKLNANTLKSVGSGAFKNIAKGATITITAKNKKTFNKCVKKLKKAGAKNCTFKYKKGK